MNLHTIGKLLQKAWILVVEVIDIGGNYHRAETIFR